MDKELIEKYRKEMLQKYRVQGQSVPAVSLDTAPTVQPVTPSPAESTGRLIAVVTSFNSLFPVGGAKVTVWTGDLKQRTEIKTAVTDQSGRTEAFVLPAPSVSLSLDSSNTLPPYALYNMTVSAEGFVDSIHLNIPVFSGVTSIQKSNLKLLETAGTTENAEVFDEAPNYGL